MKDKKLKTRMKEMAEGLKGLFPKLDLLSR